MMMMVATVRGRRRRRRTGTCVLALVWGVAGFVALPRGAPARRRRVVSVRPVDTRPTTRLAADKQATTEDDETSEKKKKQADPVLLPFVPPQDNLPTIEEALRGADLYDGPEIKDPMDMHPNDLTLYEPMTCENFTMHYDEGGHAPWDEYDEVLLAVRTIRQDRYAEAEARRREVLLDHLFWAREGHIYAKNDSTMAILESSYSILDPAAKDTRPEAMFAMVARGVDHAAHVDFLANDPLMAFRDEIFEREDLYVYSVDLDPYLCWECWPVEFGPYVVYREYQRPPTNDETAEHLSFFRKTRRVIRHGKLIPFDSATNASAEAPVGELTFSFHQSRDDAALWAKRDPFAKAGVFAPLDHDQIKLYNLLDVTGAQLQRPFPLNTLPDPLLARLVDANLVTLKERVVQRFEYDPESGEFQTFNITTNDPRVQTNVIDVDQLDPTRANFINFPGDRQGDDDDDDGDEGSRFEQGMLADDDDDGSGDGDGLTRRRRDSGPTLDAAPDLYPTELSDDYDA